MRPCGTRVLLHGSTLGFGGTRILLRGNALKIGGARVLLRGTVPGLGGTRVLLRGTVPGLGKTRVLLRGTAPAFGGTRVLLRGTELGFGEARVLLRGTVPGFGGTRVLPRWVSVGPAKSLRSSAWDRTPRLGFTRLIKGRGGPHWTTFSCSCSIVVQAPAQPVRWCVVCRARSGLAIWVGLLLVPPNGQPSGFNTMGPNSIARMPSGK